MYLRHTTRKKDGKIHRYWRHAHDVILPTPTHGEIRLRCVTHPDTAQALLLERLGMVLPRRMRLPDHELPSVAVSA